MRNYKNTQKLPFENLDINKLKDIDLNKLKDIYFLIGLVVAETLLNFFLVFLSNYIAQNVIRDIRESRSRKKSGDDSDKYR